MSKKVKILLIIIFALLFLASLCTVLYPYISNYLADQRQAAVVSQYESEVETVQDAEISAILEAARDYNAALAGGQADSVADYDDLLNLTGSGIMGIVTIPPIGVELPIYHGTQSLELGALHLQGTSLPVGGKSTHCVISAHSGMSTEVMFTDLDQLAEGDVFYMKVSSETLAYEVDRILTVLPDDTDPLMIVPGEDYCTLLTCTPYGVNTHRLLVRGHRIAYDPNDAGVIEQTPANKKQSTWMQQYLRGILCGFIFVFLGAIAVICVALLRKRKRRTNNER